MERKNRNARETTLDDFLQREMEDPEFRELYLKEKAALKVAQQVRRIRLKRHMTQKQLADKMGTSQETVSRIEQGNYTGYTLSTLSKIAKATETEIDIRFKQPVSAPAGKS